MTNLTSNIAKHFRDVFFGGNWTSVNMKDSLSDVTWQQATTKVQSFNTIATVVYHINYYVDVVTKVLLNGPLEGNDKMSFNTPPVQSQSDWDELLKKVFSNAEQFAVLIEQLPDDKPAEIFVNEKYGNYYRHLHGIIEHTHYHLGQIVLLKKMLQTAENNNNG